MQNIRHAIISAAGMGSRLGLNMPKCLVEIAGRKIIDYQLDLLQDIEDVRIVVGFMESAVMEHIKKIRNDVVFVRNNQFRTTSNSYSLHLASHTLKHPFICLDGDVLINKESFQKFLDQCTPEESVVCVTEAKTEEAVFAHLDQHGYIQKFSFEDKSVYEWSGIAYLHNIAIEKNSGYVFREIEKHLPIKSMLIECHEIDTPEDMELAISHIENYTGK